MHFSRELRLWLLLLCGCIYHAAFGFITGDVLVSNNYTTLTCDSKEAKCPSIESALQIVSEGGTVYLEEGSYSGPGNEDICLEAKRCAGLSNVTISGLGASPSDVIIQHHPHVNASNFAFFLRREEITTLRQMTIMNFPDSDSTNLLLSSGIFGKGAIYVQESKSLLLSNIVFQNNSATIGGAVSVFKSNITISGCSFLSNAARDNGAAVHSELSDVTIDDCEFSLNNLTTESTSTSGVGSALYSIGQDQISIRNSRFLYNRAERAGGALYIESQLMVLQSGEQVLQGSLLVTNCEFIGNGANGDGNCLSSGSCNTRGGALYSSVVKVVIQDSTFQDNYALTHSTTQEAQGGALYLTSNAFSSIPSVKGVTISNCHFYANSAEGTGGAIFATGQRLQVDSCVFESNSVSTVSTYFTDSPSQGGAVWYSTGGLNVGQSTVSSSQFIGNVAYSGWGGAVFGTDSALGQLLISDCDFTLNQAISSYTNFGYGGAVMVTSNIYLQLSSCTFSNNTVLPYFSLEPLTYSGSGGALFAQSVQLTVTACTFRFNVAFTGQFDAGAAGGALALENSNPVTIERSSFLGNGAAGYVGTSTFASPGAGGAIYVKFSAATVDDCTFNGNWASAGSSEKSSGGAIAVYFAYSSVSDNLVGVRINSCTFLANYALGQLCSIRQLAGQGGAIAILGDTYPAVSVDSSNFTANWAIASSASGGSFSSGGAIAVTLSSNLSAHDCSFARNVAVNGAGNDVASLVGQLDSQNYIRMEQCVFAAASIREIESVRVEAQLLDKVLCSFVQDSIFNFETTTSKSNSNSNGNSKKNPHHAFDGKTQAIIARTLQQAELVLQFGTSDELQSCAHSLPPSSIHSSFRATAGVDTIPAAAGASSVGIDSMAEDSAIAEVLLAICASDSQHHDATDAATTATVAAAVEIAAVQQLFIPLLRWARESEIVSANFTAAVEGAINSGAICTSAHTDTQRILYAVFTLYALRDLSPVDAVVDFYSSNSNSNSVEEERESSVFSKSQHRGFRAATANDTQSISDCAGIVMLRAKYLKSLRNELEQYSAQLSVQSQQQPQQQQQSEEQTNFQQFSGLDFNFLNSSALKALRDFHPGIVVTTGFAVFKDPTFLGVYHVFFGNFPAIITFAYDISVTNFLISSAAVARSESIIYGRINYEHLILTAVSSDITLLYEDGSDAALATSSISGNSYGVNDSVYALDQLNLFNSTLRIANNMSLIRDSFLTSSTVSGVPGSLVAAELPQLVASGDYFNLPHLYIEKKFFSGIALPALLSNKVNAQQISSFFTKFNASQQTLFALDSCILVVDDGGVVILDSPVQNLGDDESVTTLLDATITNVRVLLHNNALLSVAAGGTLQVIADTVIDAGSQDAHALRNAGKVQLLGQTSSSLLLQSEYLDLSRYYRLAAMGSLTSKLNVQGIFEQTEVGSTLLILNSTRQEIPVMYISTNEYFAGQLQLRFFVHNNIYPNLYLEKYSGVSSQWQSIVFGTAAKSAPKLSVAAPAGLQFTAALDTVQLQTDVRGRSVAYSGSADSYTKLQLKTKEIGCSAVNLYYSGVPQDLASSSSSSFPCYICLQNSSCAICSNDGGQCGDIGSCTHGTKYKSDCCDGGCNGVYGNCHANDAHTKYECRCTTIFYDGSHCDELTAAAYAMIFSAVFLFLLLLLIAYFYRRARMQKKVVLDELADGLLNNQNSSENSAYIQSMQQALILNDVFVNYDEIKLEYKVGEGSFGEVHKATFRGAQVAVKKMRSMFAELTDREIDEFRKEAYVMSRLRHPNIVLVMGISLVEQEPVQLPKMRSAQSPSIDMDEYGSSYRVDGGGGVNISSSRKAGAASKPPKTVCIITEFLEQGSLADILYGPTRLPAEVWTYELILTCALQAARGMLYLHSHKPLPICHRDLKSSNLVVDDHWVVKVTDFGMSRIVPENVQDREKGLDATAIATPTAISAAAASKATATASAVVKGEETLHRSDGADEERESSEQLGSLRRSSYIGPNARRSVSGRGGAAQGGAPDRLSSFNPEMTSNLGTTAWCAPELLTATTRSRYTVKVDVYSFGMVLWELWEKKRPYEELTSRFDVIDAIRDGNRPSISNNCPPSYRSLIQRCWHSDPARRPMFKYIARYLKDELARVKRQRALMLQQQAGVLNSSTSIGDPLINPLHSGDRGESNSRNSTSDYGGSGSNQISSFLRRSFQAATSGLSFSGGSNGRDDRPSEIQFGAAELQAPPGASFVELGVTGSSSISRNREVDPCAADTGGRRSSRSSDTGAAANIVDDDVAAESSALGSRGYPELRSPLIAAAAYDRSLSYLTSDNPSISQKLRAEAAASANAGTASAINKNQNPARWRDKYVLKFSGWQSRNPDVGLPPSLSAPSPIPRHPQQQQQQRPLAEPATASASIFAATGNGSSGAATTTSAAAAAPAGSAGTQMFSLLQTAANLQANEVADSELAHAAESKHPFGDGIIGEQDEAPPSSL